MSLILKKVSMLVICLSLLLGGNVSALASSGNGSNDAAVIDELWGVPILAYGASLSASQLDEVKAILDVRDGSFDSVAVDGYDLVYFLGRGNSNASMFSSVLITRREAGSGVFVAILTPENITRVTEIQYANAMITAGVTDALVEVASPIPVTGEAALTGIYKAFYERGIEFDSDRMEVAQEELELTSSIAIYHEDNEDFDQSNLDHAIIDIKSNLAEIYYSAGVIANDEQVQEVIREALIENDLDDIVTPEQALRMANFAQSFQLTDAINSPELREQLSDLANRVESILENVTREEALGWFHRIVNFFRRIFN